MNISVKAGDTPLLSGLATALCGALEMPPPAELELLIGGRLIDADPDPELRLVEALEAAGLRPSSISATLAEARWAAEPLVARAPTSDDSIRWVAVLGSRRRKLWVAIADQAGIRRRLLSMREVSQLLGVPNERTQISFFQVEAALPLEGLRTQGEQKASAWGRLRALTRLERREISTLVLYAVVVGFLSLAVPAAVQTLVNTVAFGTVLQPLVVLTLILFICLALSGFLRVLQFYAVEILERRIFVRATLDVAARLPRVDDHLRRKYDMPELVNRFFDVITVQKSASILLLDALELALQTLMGMILLAIYHPLLLVLDVVIILALLFVLFVLGRGSTRTALEESDAKYAVAAWLEDVAAQPEVFRSTRGAQAALERANGLTTRWLDRRSEHFRVVMRQFIGGVGIQVVATTLVLGLGGWLVLSEQLTLGQLVASELIVTLVVAGIAKLGKHLGTLYDLLAGTAKLGKLVDLPLDGRRDHPLVVEADHNLTVSGYTLPGEVRVPDLVLRPGERLVVRSASPACRRLLLEGLEGRGPAGAGKVRLNGEDIRRMSLMTLGDRIMRVSGPSPVGGTVLEYLTLGLDGVRVNEVDAALEAVGLVDVISELPDGLESRLLSSGAPLTYEQAALLSVARALLSGPQVLLLDDWVDQLPRDSQREMFEALSRWITPVSLIVATHRHVDEACCWDHVIELNPTPEEI